MNFTHALNLLPCDGIAEYYPDVLKNDSEFYFQKLLKDIQWKSDEVRIFGKVHITKRKVAWYGNENIAYTYSGNTKNAIPWTNELLKLKEVAETVSGVKFNSCLLNLYHDGSEGMSWHSDNEKELGNDPSICSISFGAERKFTFKHKVTKHTIPVLLENGSILLMKGKTQSNWLHSLPKTKKCTNARINLTFRKIIV